MKVLLTGATGFLGSHLLRMFLENHHEVIVLKRSSSNIYRIASLLPQVILYDVDNISLESIFHKEREIDLVIHTATSYGRRGESLEELVSSNFLFPLRLMQELAKSGHGVFINTDTSLDRYSNYYALTKKQFLDWGKILSSNQCLQFVNVKLEHMYGPGDDQSKFTSFLISECARNTPYIELTEGEQLRDFIYIDDVIEAYRIIIDVEHREFYDEFELGSGTAISIRNFAQIVHRITKSETELRFGARPYRPNELMHSEANISKLIRMGWEQKVDLEEGIRSIVHRDFMLRDACGAHK